MSISTTAKAEKDCGLPAFPSKISKGWFKKPADDDPDRPASASEKTAKWVVMRERKDHWDGMDGESVNIEAIPGSMWATPERRAQSWGEAGGALPPPANFLRLQIDRRMDVDGNVVQGTRPASCSIRLRCTHKRHGEEAGILAYIDDANWVKVTLCGDKKAGEVNVILAQQFDGVPFVKGKTVLGARHGWNELSPQAQRLGEEFVQLPVSLRLEFSPGGYDDKEPTAGGNRAPPTGESVPGTGRMRAYFAISNGGWQPVVRGRGWLEPEELFGQRPRGFLLDGDHRQGQVAECEAPPDEVLEGGGGKKWSWALGASNFGEDNRWVCFERL